MPEIITVQSFPEFNFLQETELTADAVAGATSITVKNTNGFNTNHVILIGEPGAEGSEIRQPSSVSSGSIALVGSPLTQAQKKGKRVYLLRANKARIYAAPNVDGSQPITDTYSLLGTVTFLGDKNEIEYEHTTGGSNYWYLYTLYNDIPSTPEETDKILTDAVRGGGYGNYATVDDVRQEAGLTNNRWIKDALIYEKLIAAESEVNSSLLLGKYTLPLTTVPAKVRHATILLAAGYVLTIDYGPEQSGTNKEGESKIAMARKILLEIESGKGGLVDQQGEVIATGSNIGGYPDDTAANNSPSEAPMFSITDTF